MGFLHRPEKFIEVLDLIRRRWLVLQIAIHRAARQRPPKHRQAHALYERAVGVGVGVEKGGVA